MIYWCSRRYSEYLILGYEVKCLSQILVSLSSLGKLQTHRQYNSLEPLREGLHPFCQSPPCFSLFETNLIHETVHTPWLCFV